MTHNHLVPGSSPGGTTNKTPLLRGFFTFFALHTFILFIRIMKIFCNSFFENYKLITILVMSLMYVFVGVKHFSDPHYFINITPPQIQHKLFAVYFTGILEILGGLLILSKKTRKTGAYILIILLIIVFPANIYLYLSEIPQELLGISKTQALTRMPFQAPLILLAYWHSKENHPKWVAYLSSLAFPPTIIYFLSI